jgi:hypothetical protein
MPTQHKSYSKLKQQHITAATIKPPPILNNNINAIDLTAAIKL